MTVQDALDDVIKDIEQITATGPALARLSAVLDKLEAIRDAIANE